MYSVLLLILLTEAFDNVEQPNGCCVEIWRKSSGVARPLRCRSDEVRPRPTPRHVVRFSVYIANCIKLVVIIIIFLVRLFCAPLSVAPEGNCLHLPSPCCRTGTRHLTNPSNCQSIHLILLIKGTIKMSINNRGNQQDTKAHIMTLRPTVSL